MQSPQPTGLFACQRELLELFEVLVDVIFCAKDREGRYVAVNQAFVRRTERSSKREVVGARASDLFDPLLAERYEEQDAQVFSSGEPLRDQLELIRRVDGSLGWYLTFKQPVGADGLVSISRDLGTPSRQAVAMESLNQLIDFMHENMADTIRLAEMAKVAGCTESQLDRRVRKVFGMSPTQLLLRTRVEQAAHLLTETDHPLAEIALTVGFYDQADFTRRFARLTNATPARFRTQSRLHSDQRRGG